MALRRNKKDDAWIVDVSYNGERRFATIRDKKVEARKKEVEIRTQMEEGTYRSNGDIPTFKDLADRWLASKKSDLRASTHKLYETHIRVHLKPLGGLKVNQVGYGVIEGLRDNLVESGKSARSIQKVLTTLTAIMSYAIRCRYINFNPAKEIPRPRRTKEDHKQMNPFSPEELRAIFGAVKDQKYHLMIKLSALSGLRQGECIGLLWSDFHWQEGQIHVQRTFNHGQFYPVKTKAGERKVDLAPDLVRELKEWRLSSRYSQDEDLVFPSETGRPMSHSNLVKRIWKPIFEGTGIPYRNWHQLRHSYSSISLQNGEPIHVVSKSLGHSSPMVTLTLYAWAIPQDNSEAAERLSRTILGE